MVARWQFIKETVTGATHLRQQKPNQDAIRHYETDTLLMIAVADGHGGEKYTHSKLGAQFAVQAAMTVLKNTFKEEADFSLSQIKHLAENDIPKAIVRCWRDAVDQYCVMHPPLEEKYKYRYFGTTLLTVLALPRCLVYWQLGDGDIVTVTDEALISWPMAADSRLLGNETTSLYGDKPWLDFRCTFQAITDAPPPRCILLASDGYSNAYASHADFEQTVVDLVSLIKSEGIQWVRQQLPAWLNEASQKGSGDDISVGILYNGESEIALADVA
jgi:serine/threonine protein phosphatase PrpC